jgi:hypothetical protein
MMNNEFTHHLDGRGSTDLWNVGKVIPVCMALQPRRQPSSFCYYLLLSYDKWYDDFEAATAIKVYVLLNIICSWWWCLTHYLLVLVSPCCGSFVFGMLFSMAVVVGWLLLFINMQNPGYMKENFVIIIESLHLADKGNQQNVSHRLCCWQSAGFLHVRLSTIFHIMYTYCKMMHFCYYKKTNCRVRYE